MQRQQVKVDDSHITASYANFCRVTGTPEELIIDFGLNPQPFGIPPDPVIVTQRIVTNYFTAKRMLHALQLTVQRHEATFGVLETDVQKRVCPAPVPARIGLALRGASTAGSCSWNAAPVRRFAESRGRHVNRLDLVAKPFTVLHPWWGVCSRRPVRARPKRRDSCRSCVMDVTKWSAVLLGIASLAGGGCCCNQPGSWWGGSTYAGAINRRRILNRIRAVYGHPVRLRSQHR